MCLMKHVLSVLALSVLALPLLAQERELTLRGKQANAYVLGAGDEVSIEVVELPEFSAKSYPIDSDGRVSLPLIGRMQASGLTLAQFESELDKKLRTQVQSPHVVTSLLQTHSQPVSVMGAVTNPGTQQLQGTRTLFDVLAAAGGLKQDAGNTITITRQADQGMLKLAGATQDAVNGRSMAEVSVHDVVDLKDPKANIVIRPRDEISVSRARVLYVIGNVKKAGGFTLSSQNSISALEALSLAEGLSANAKPSHARVLRKSETNTAARIQIPVDLKKILAGKAEDIQLTAGDILYVPDSTARRIAAKSAEAALATVSGLIIWRGI